MAKKRKRRSFWEPDSKEVVSWMDAQDNLGQSLQLIITDAIFKYGRGDAIEIYLQERFVDSKKDIKKNDVRKETITKVASDVDTIVNVIQPEVIQPEPAEVSREPVVPVKQTVDIISEEKPTIPVSEEKPYDPVEVMFGDLGASYGN